MTAIGNETIDNFLTNIEKYPHVYVLGSLMDRQMNSRKCWEIPYKIYEIMGYDFNILKLNEKSEEEYKNIFKDNKLHRFNNSFASIWFYAIKDIINKYDGDASKIWNDNPSSALIVRRFLEFKGCAEKISTMAVNILVREYKVQLSDYRYIDISVDTHVTRVMKRMGLTNDSNSQIIIYRAREINPEFPGIFDFLLYELGTSCCTARSANCSECRFNEHCPKIGTKQR